MKKEIELKHKEKTNLNKHNYIIIIVPILLVLLLIAAIALYVFVYSNPASKLKKYLVNNAYTCNKNSCSIQKGNETHIVYFKTGDISISTEEYDCYISSNNITYQSKTNEKVCTYYKENYQRLNPIDNSFTTDVSCEKNIDTINKNIIYYKELFTNIDIDVNKLTK